MNLPVISYKISLFRTTNGVEYHTSYKEHEWSDARLDYHNYVRDLGGTTAGSLCLHRLDERDIMEMEHVTLVRFKR